MPKELVAKPPSKDATLKSGLETAIASGGLPAEQIGLEEIGAEDIILPHLILVQDRGFYADAGHQEGTFVNSLTKKQVEDPVIVPFYAMKYWDLLRRDADRMVFEARVVDEGDPRLIDRKFFSNKEGKADCNTVLAVMAVLEGRPVIVAFSKTSYKTGKTLVSLAKLSGGPFYGQRYALGSVKEINKKGDKYWVSEVTPVGYTTQEEQDLAHKYYELFKLRARGIKAGVSGEDAAGDVPF